MPVTSIDTDVEALTMTVVSDFPVPTSRFWEDVLRSEADREVLGPSRLARHLLPPRHGGRGLSLYYMTGPNGEQMNGIWEIVHVDVPSTLEVRDRFVGEDGNADDDVPSMRVAFDFDDHDGGSRLTVTTWFTSVPDLEQMLEMGMDEGLRTAMAQINHVVADLASFAAGSGTTLQVLDDTHVRITRIIHGTVQKVWDAHQEPELMRRWMLDQADGPCRSARQRLSSATGMGRRER